MRQEGGFRKETRWVKQHHERGAKMRYEGRFKEEKKNEKKVRQ